MTAPPPADRPLSYARLNALPIGAIVIDRTGNLWLRIPDRRHTGHPGWFQNAQGQVASPTTLHTDHRPLHHRGRRP
jgi:hypothetical protein